MLRFRFLVLQIITVFGKFTKNREKTKNKLRTIYPKNHECLKNNKTGVQFTGSYKKDPAHCVKISSYKYR